MKIRINENQLEDIVIKYIRKHFGEQINDVYFEGKKLIVVLPGEENYLKISEIKPKIYKELNLVFGKYFPIEITFETRFYGNVDIKGDEESGYNVVFTKELDNGETFEVSGTLEEFHDGRDVDYRFEPQEISNEKYYDDNWENIEEFILNKFYYR